MSHRHHAALSAHEIPHTTAQLIDALYDAKTECEVYDIDPRSDSAVLLLTQQLAFQINADAIDRNGLEMLKAHCRHERNRRHGKCPAAH